MFYSGRNLDIFISKDGKVHSGKFVADKKDESSIKEYCKCFKGTRLCRSKSGLEGSIYQQLRVENFLKSRRQ